MTIPNMARMRAKEALLSADYVRSILDYDPHTGVFRWRWRDDVPDYVNTRWAGKIAGSKRPRGEVAIKIGYAHYLAHRVAWVHVTGEWPSGELDHEDVNPSNNRFSNLRPATCSLNHANLRILKTSKSGIKGVTYDAARKLWMARITVKGKFKNLGRFSTPEAAHAAYVEAAKIYFGEFARAA